MKLGKKKHSNDTEIFRAAMSGVQPLKPDNRLALQSPRPNPTPAQSLRDEKSALHELMQPSEDRLEPGTCDKLDFLRSGYPPSLLRRVRRGYFNVSDSIDLHQMTEKVAKEVLLHFLAEAILSGYRCVRIVHGKGLNSKGKPKLKLMTYSILRQHPSVIVFVSCRPVDGGTGAVNVLLDNQQVGSR